ncbi:helix-turn-helix domain-containing protein [Devosia sp. PTR5]|uniref:Helix-turn-helix domain-containing protein n=1 Tax=Devosia oryzisoli TaxID=2774138 RepID=A0A927IQX1_9HYPH|nr:helix-turn-helix domain-containing protein [Devosia oryzisoli]
MTSDYHAHHAIQLGLALTGTCQFRTRRDADWIHYSGALIPPNFEHTFQAPGDLVANLFCDPESTVGRMIAGRLNARTITPLDADTTGGLAAELKHAFLTGADTNTLMAAAKRCFTLLIDGASFATPTDPRIERAVAEIHRRINEPLTLGEIAGIVNLSEGRFRHLFVSETGLHFRAYVLWARLNKALQLGFAGSSWTEAAHAANFSDAAHLTRTCQRMFGFAPTHAQRGQIEMQTSSVM